MDKSDWYKVDGLDFWITDEPIIEENTDPRLLRDMDKAYRDVQLFRSGVIKRLKKLCVKYPHKPQFKNYLSAAYEKAGQTDQAVRVNQQIREVHPDYLFGKINVAAFHIKEGKLEEAKELLGEQPDLQQLEPEREVFHQTEVLAYYNNLIKYYRAKDDNKQAKKYLNILEEIAPDHPEAMRHRLAMGFSFFEAMNAEYTRKVEARSYDTSIQTEEAPKLTHPEIEALYQQDMHIPYDLVKEILALPRATLIADLEKVMEDCIRRYEYFYEQADPENGGWDEKKFSFPLHAMYMLAELKSYSSLPKMWHVLRQGNELLEFWFSDLITEELWELFYILGKDQLELLKAYALEPNIYNYSRTLITTVVSQLAINETSRRPEVIAWFRDLFAHFLDNPEDEGIIDTEAIGLMVSDCLDFKGIELLNQIEQLCERDWVPVTMSGDFEEIKYELEQGTRADYNRPVREDIFARYSYNLKSWTAYREEKPDVFGEMDVDRNDIGYDYDWDDREDYPLSLGSGIVTPIKRQTPKTGRNEPCPCGSGKKYKKCCLNK